jgi:pectin methylesterase-like acyl-CoA thioesterase
MRHYILCLVIISLISLPAWGAPRVGINNSGAVYETIQDAVNAAASGDTIKVSAGTYNENVTINNKALTISGIIALTALQPAVVIL